MTYHHYKDLRDRGIFPLKGMYVCLHVHIYKIFCCLDQNKLNWLITYIRILQVG
jgi:hypothetical protein